MFFSKFRRIRGKLKQKELNEDQELRLDNSGLSPTQIAHGLQCLDALELSEKQDHLSRDDMMQFLYAIGLNPSPDIIESKLRTLKIYEQVTFSFAELAHIWQSMIQDLQDEDELLRRAFQFFDKDGNGDISMQELVETMHELGDLLDREEIERFMNIMDVNSDGVISYDEFLTTLRSQASGVTGDLPEPAASPAPQEVAEVSKNIITEEMHRLHNISQTKLLVASPTGKLHAPVNILNEQCITTSTATVATTQVDSHEISIPGRTEETGHCSQTDGEPCHPPPPQHLLPHVDDDQRMRSHPSLQPPDLCIDGSLPSTNNLPPLRHPRKVSSLTRVHAEHGVDGLLPKEDQHGAAL